MKAGRWSVAGTIWTAIGGAAVVLGLVGGSGERGTVLAGGGRLLAPGPARARLDRAAVARVAALPLPPKIAPVVARWLERDAQGKRNPALQGGELLLVDGA